MSNNTAKARVTEAIVSLPPAPSGKGVDVLALTEDDFFLLAARKVVTLPNRIWHATSDTQAADMLMSTPCAVALLDVSLMQSQLPATIARLRQQFPDLGFVVVGEADAAAAVAPLVDSGEVRGFVIKQYAGRRLAAALQAGIDRHFDILSETASRRALSGGKRSTVIGITVGIVAAIAVAGAAAWYWMGGEKEAAPGTTVAPAATPALSSTEQSLAVEQTLQQAREAFDAGRYLAAGKNPGAADHYRSVLGLDPVNAEAKDGLSRITEILLARTELALVEGNMRQANENLKAAKGIEPSNARISFLETQISRETSRTASAQQEAERIQELNRKLDELSKARAAQAAPAPTPTATPAAPKTPTQQQQQRSAAEADRLLALGYERLTQGKLLQPEEDNAQYYLLKLKQLQADHPSLEGALTALRERLIADTQAALTRNNPTQARALLDGARNVGAEGKRIDQIAADVSRASLQAQLLTTPEPVRESMFTRKVEPTYPNRARRENVEGYVDARFIVSKTGEVRDVVIIGAQPQATFEEEAIRAIKKWKVKPRTIDGETYEQLLSVRLRFRLD